MQSLFPRARKVIPRPAPVMPAALRPQLVSRSLEGKPGMKHSSAGIFTISRFGRRVAFWRNRIPIGLCWFLAVLVAAAVASSAQAQTATVTAVLGPTAPTFTDDVYAVVTVAAAAAPVPTGSVTWDTDGGSQLTAPLVNGVARIELKFFAPAAHTFDYSYSGDGTYAAVASQSAPFNVADRAFTLYGADHPLTITGPSQIDNVALDSKDNIIITDHYQNKLFRTTPRGITTEIPTTGLNNPLGVVLDKQDNIFVADDNNARVVEVTASGVQSVLPITGLVSAFSVSFDPAYQNLYVTDFYAGNIVIFNLATQTQTTFSTGMIDIMCAAVDAAGNLYFAQSQDVQQNTGHLYRRDTAGNVTEVFTGIINIAGMFLDAKGDLYLDANNGTFVLDPQGHLTQLTTQSYYTAPSTPAVDSEGRLYIAHAGLSVFTPGTSGDSGLIYAVYEPLDPTFTIPESQGDITLDYQAPYNQLFTSMSFGSGSFFQTTSPQTGYTASPTGTPFLLQAFLPGEPNTVGPWSSTVTITTTDNTIHTNVVYGTGVGGQFAVTPGVITPGSPGVASVGGVATDGAGNVYVSDTTSNDVLKVGSSTSAAVPFTGLNAPTQVGVDALGTVTVLDSGTSRILRVDAQGNQTVVFDLGMQSTLTSLSTFAMDRGNNLYVAGASTAGQAAIVYIDTFGDQYLIAQNIALPASLALDGIGNIYAVETAGGNLRRYDEAGNPTLVATGLTQPADITVDPGGTAFVTGPAGSGISIVRPDGTVTSYPSTALANASVITSDSQGNLVVGDNTGKQIFGVNRAQNQQLGYDFGNVPLGTPEIYPGTLTNAGNAVTSDWSLTPSHDETALTSDPNECAGDTPTPNAPLQAGGYCNMTITFTPTYLGPMNDSYGNGDTYFVVQPSSFGIYLSLNLTGNGTTPVGTPTLSPNPLNFGNVTVNTASGVQQILLTNNNISALTISSVAISGANAAEFSESNTCPATLPANNSCAILVTFTPTAAGAATATVTLTDNATTSTSTVALTGTGVAAAGTPAATLTPAALSFTTVAGSTPAPQVATLTNSGTAALVISQVSIGGATAGAYSQTNDCGISLAAGASCAITVSFNGTGVGSYPAALQVADNAPNTPQSVTLSGTVTAAVTSAPIATLTPTSLSYSAASGSATAAQNATLTNSGTAVLNISGIKLTGANTSEFAISANTCGAMLAVNASCTISVTFTPDSVASFTAAISVADDAAGSPQTSTLTGTGTAAAVADFTVAATPATQSVTAGSAATYSIPIASSGGTFTDAVTLSATGFPPGATVTFLPASVMPGAAGGQSTMTVQTAVQQAASSQSSSRWPFTPPVFAALLLLIPGWRARKRWNAKVTRAFFTSAGCLLALLGMLATITGCGAGFALPQTPASGTTYIITVTGTSGSVQHNTTVQITVR